MSVISDCRFIIEYKNFKNDRIETYSGVAITRKYFEDNKLVSVKFFDANDEPIKNKKPWEKKNSEWRFEYDEKNNFVKQLAYNHLGENCVVENWGNSAIEIFKYNDKNQLIEKANYNKNMELVGLGDIRDAITRYGYNDDGQLIWKKSFNDRDKFLANGYCYSKFEYNKDGTLKKHIYLYDENKINTYSIYTYEDKRLKKEESFNDANEKVGYEIYDYDENGKIIRLEDWYYKRDKPNIKKRQISLELEGWIIPEGDLANFNFENFGEGKYIISVNSSGKIENIEPDEYKGGTKERKIQNPGRLEYQPLDLFHPTKIAIEIIVVDKIF